MPRPPVPPPIVPVLFLDHLEGPVPCAGRWDIYDTPTAANATTARRLCARCPVRDACATHALETAEPAGIWADTTPADRGYTETGRRTRRRAYPCGTEGAYQQHRRANETCTECDTAHTARVDAGRRADLARFHANPTRRTNRGYALHRLLGEPPCPDCRARLRPHTPAAA